MHFFPQCFRLYVALQEILFYQKTGILSFLVYLRNLPAGANRPNSDPLSEASLGVALAASRSFQRQPMRFTHHATLWKCHL